MLRQLWYDFVTSYKNYRGTGPILVLFVVALLLIVIKGIRNKDNRLFAAVFGGIATIGCAFSEFFYSLFDRKYEKKSERVYVCAFALILCVLVTALAGNRVFSRNYEERAENTKHISTDLMGVMDNLLAKETGDICIFPSPELGDELTAYSSRFIPAYEEYYGDVSKYDESIREAYVQLLEVHPDMEKVSKAAKMCNSRYVLLENGKWPERPLEDYGYSLVDSNEGFSVYEYIGEVTLP